MITSRTIQLRFYPISGRFPAGLHNMADIDKGTLVISDEARAQGSSLSPIESDGGSTSTNAVVQETPKRTWRSYLWDTWDKPPEERRLLFKLDLALMVRPSLRISSHPRPT